MAKEFTQIRERKSGHPKGDMVFNKKISNVPVMIHKEKSDFVVYIDGDKLDAYGSQKEAEKMAKEFVKQYRG